MKKNNKLVITRVLNSLTCREDYYLNGDLIMCPEFARFALFGRRTGEDLPLNIKVTVSNFYRPGCIRIRFDGQHCTLPRFKSWGVLPRVQYVFEAARILLTRAGLVTADGLDNNPRVDPVCSIWLSATPVVS